MSESFALYIPFTPARESVFTTGEPCEISPIEPTGWRTYITNSPISDSESVHSVDCDWLNDEAELLVPSNRAMPSLAQELDWEYHLSIHPEFVPENRSGMFTPITEKTELRMPNLERVSRKGISWEEPNVLLTPVNLNRDVFSPEFGSDNEDEDRFASIERAIQRGTVSTRRG